MNEEQMPSTVIFPSLKSGEESFLFNNQEHAKLQDFWRWGFSNLMDNSLRGVLAEFIVRLALTENCANEVRVNWIDSDLKSKSELKIEVKSSAYFQWWHQKEKVMPDIRFNIAPTSSWNPKTNEYDKEKNAVHICMCFVY